MAWTVPERLTGVKQKSVDSVSTDFSFQIKTLPSGFLGKRRISILPADPGCVRRTTFFSVEQPSIAKVNEPQRTQRGKAATKEVWARLQVVGCKLQVDC